MELNHQYSAYLEGKHLVQMVSKFTEGLMTNLEKEFATDGIFGNSGDWVTLDFCDFSRRQFTLASIPSLYGSHILEIWPGAYEEFFDFDAHAHSLLLDLPRVLLPTAFAKRDKILSVLGRWEDDAYKYRDFQSIEVADPDWDEYWGSRLIRARHRAFLKNGISKAGRCAEELALLWGYCLSRFLTQ